MIGDARGAAIVDGEKLTHNKANMNDQPTVLVLPEISRRIVGCFYDVYNELGHGFLEAVYQRALLIALTQAGINCRTEVPIDVQFRGVSVGTYRADIVVDALVVLECKAGAAISPGHQAQLIHYLKATGLTLGIILNFGPKPSFKRMLRAGA